MTRPLIQIDDLVREMTEEEYAQYVADIEGSKGLYPVLDETPVVDDLVEGEQP